MSLLSVVRDHTLCVVNNVARQQQLLPRENHPVATVAGRRPRVHAAALRAFRGVVAEQGLRENDALAVGGVDHRSVGTARRVDSLAVISAILNLDALPGDRRGVNAADKEALHHDVLGRGRGRAVEDPLLCLRAARQALPRILEALGERRVVVEVDTADLELAGGRA